MPDERRPGFSSWLAATHGKEALDVFMKHIDEYAASIAKSLYFSC